MTFDPPKEINDVFLKPCEFHWGDSSTRIRTLLGSCVAVCIWHPKYRIGGMTHSLLPTRTEQGEELSARYVDEGVELLFQETQRTMTKSSDYICKVFGGGKMFPWFSRPDATPGARNLEVLTLALAKAGFTTSANQTGLSGHRSIIFELWSGDVWMRHQKL